MSAAAPKPPRDRHPEISAPILDLGLEAQIARAEQAIIDREKRLSGGARRIVETLRSKRGAVVRWAAIAGGAAVLGAVGYAGYRAWRGRSSTSASDTRRQPSKAAGFAAELAAFARLATHLALKLHREQGVAGTLFGTIRSALWPNSRSAATPPTEHVARSTPSAPRSFDADA